MTKVYTLVLHEEGYTYICGNFDSLELAMAYRDEIMRDRSYVGLDDFSLLLTRLNKGMMEETGRNNVDLFKTEKDERRRKLYEEDQKRRLEESKKIDRRRTIFDQILLRK